MINGMEAIGAYEHVHGFRRGRDLDNEQRKKSIIPKVIKKKSE